MQRMTTRVLGTRQPPRCPGISAIPASAPLALAFLIMAIPAAGRAQSETAARVNAPRLQESLETLSTFGRPAGGTFADGVSRVAYSDADVAGRAYVMGLMREAGLDPHIDPAGNIIGKRAGSDPSLKPIVFGSHIDSVRNGGNFDGDVGSMGAIEAIRTLNDHHIPTRHPLEVAIWSNEEGGTHGSASLLETPGAATLNRDFYGITMRDGLRKIGGDPDRLAEVLRKPGSMCCYLELHVEQGGNLEKAGIQIGVVDGIVGIDDYAVEVKGFANHAGTTPMAGRKDALYAASYIVQAVRDVTNAMPGRQVGTVGRFEVFPDAPNVIPGRVSLSIQFRDLSESTIDSLGKAMALRVQEIARQTGTEITMTHLERARPALANKAIQSDIEASIAGLGLTAMHLPSGAGHDAQEVAKLAPMGMIFVPSIGGISHSPKELSRWPDIANGANVLLQTILRIDAKPDPK
ncbi:N-carbamoyl-L-amino-acid hydrolase [Bryocella elongata]|uniref:N-carbamoyl-L-amino-acid hydrolase n=1 Tax=Bryocella elongata TaxID=863522 RepID=A0A1H5WRB3_9BACT|nr:Zn-dependent hydrolase [Bryocella elongata]SEG01487.1 N-carbamoyl-L-amino-acid hydrolase [Bryocella elongata]